MATHPVEFNVSGDFSVQRKPELCTINISVQLEGPDPAFVSAKVTTKMNELVAELRALAPPNHGAEVDGQLVIDSAFPVTNWSAQSVTTSVWTDRKPQPPPRAELARTAAPGEQQWVEKIVHHARATAEATFHNFEALGDFAARVAAQDLAKVDGLSWDVAPLTRKSLQTSVRQEALRDAIAKARDYAQVIGGPDANVRVTEVNDSGGPIYRQNKAAFGVAAFASGGHQPERINFEPAPVDISANVMVKCVLA